MSEFTRTVKFFPAWDKRHSEPSKNYGIGAASILFSVAKDGEGLTFELSTGWFLPHNRRESDKPYAFGVDLHTKTPRYEGHSPTNGCHITGGKCYCDGSALLGDEFFETLVAEGEEGLWKRMEQQFRDWHPKQEVA
jgi:hypothetical protein